MRDHNKAFCRLVAETFDGPGPVFEVGSYQVEGQEGYANLRHLFPGQDSVGCDMRPGPGRDRVEDVTALRAGSSTRKPRRPRGEYPPDIVRAFCARRSDRPKRRTVAWRASVSSDRRAQSLPRLPVRKIRELGAGGWWAVSCGERPVAALTVAARPGPTQRPAGLSA